MSTQIAGGGHSGAEQQRPYQIVPGELPVQVRIDAFRLAGTVYVFAYAFFAFNGVTISFSGNRSTSDLSLVLNAPHVPVVAHDFPLSAEIVLNDIDAGVDKITVSIDESGFDQKDGMLLHEDRPVTIRDENLVTAAELALVQSRTPGRVIVQKKNSPAFLDAETLEEWQDLGVAFVGRPLKNPVPVNPIKPLRILLARGLATYDDLLSQHCSTSCSKVTDEGFGVKLCTQYQTVCQHIRNSLLLNVTATLGISVDELGTMVSQCFEDATVAGVLAGLVTSFATEGNIAAGFAAASDAFLDVFIPELKDRLADVPAWVNITITATLTNSSEWV